METFKKIACVAGALILSGVLPGCRKSAPRSEAKIVSSADFSSYWHSGKAEISSYHLSQSRYGETRKGNAVLIFVTEDLSKKLQVKADNLSYRHKVNVLKLNFTKNFVTGIYPYSMMLSVFTPVDRQANANSLKATMSSQEWCGQVFMQLNLRGNRYSVKSHSYFEQEADERYSVRESFLEDEIWNVIRLDHEHLPIGEMDMLPGLFFTRLNHVDFKIQSAICEKQETDSAFVYSVQYPHLDRKLAIRYEKKFPFSILGWEEIWEEKGTTMKTSAVLDKTLYTDYWTKNKNEFEYLRDSLGLPRH